MAKDTGIEAFRRHFNLAAAFLVTSAGAFTTWAVVASPESVWQKLSTAALILVSEVAFWRLVTLVTPSLRSDNRGSLDRFLIALPRKWRPSVEAFARDWQDEIQQHEQHGFSKLRSRMLLAVQLLLMLLGFSVGAVWKAVLGFILGKLS